MSSPAPVQSDMITLGDIIHAVWQRKWLCVIIVLAFFLVGLAVSVMKTPKYTFSQVLVRASIPDLAHLTLESNPIALSEPYEVEQWLANFKDNSPNIKLSLPLSIKKDINIPSGSLVTFKAPFVTLTLNAPLSQTSKAKETFKVARDVLVQYQAPLIHELQQSIHQSLIIDRQAISDLQQRQRDLERSTKLVVTHTMPSPDAILSATHSSDPSAPPHETSTVTESLERIANAEDAQLMLASANLEQQMLSVKQQLVADQAQLSLIQPAHFIGDMQRSQDPVGMSSKLLLLMFTVLGMVVAVFVSLLLAFSTSRSSESTNES